MMAFQGMRVFVSRATAITVRRTWRERLFSLPWRPLQATRQEWTAPIVPPDECYRIDDELHCGERFYENLKALTNGATP